jgi:hypothetical protein
MLTPATAPSPSADLSPAAASLRGLDEVERWLVRPMVGVAPANPAGGLTCVFGIAKVGSALVNTSRVRGLGVEFVTVRLPFEPSRTPWF